MQIDAVYGHTGEKGKPVKRKTGKGKGNRAARSSRAIVAIAESGETSNETVATRKQSLRLTRKPLLIHQTAAAPR